MRYAIAVVISLTAVTRSAAQHGQWTFGTVSDDWIWDGQAIWDDGGFLMVGNSNNKIFLIRTDAESDTIWTKRYGRASGSIQTQRIHHTSDGGFIVSGYTSESPWDPYYGFLLKLDANGNRMWSKTYGTGNRNLFYEAFQTTDGGYLMAGAEGYGVGRNQIYVVKADSAGDVQWTRNFAAHTTGHAFGASQTPDGGYAVCGEVWDSAAADYYTVLIRLDADGNLLWNKAHSLYGGSFIAFNATADGGFVAAGYQAEPPMYLYEDASLLKLDSLGNPQWYKRYNASPFDYGYDVVETEDNGFAVAGCTNEPGGTRSFYLLKTDTNGNAEWSKSYGNYVDHMAYAVALNADNGYTLAGIMKWEAFGNRDYYIVRTDKFGASGCRENDLNTIAANVPTQTTELNFDITTGGVGADLPLTESWLDIAETDFCLFNSIDESTRETLFNVYPNPNNGVFTLTLRAPASASQLVITNPMGQKVLETSTNETPQQVTLPDRCADGFYAVRVLDRLGTVLAKQTFVLTRGR